MQNIFYFKYIFLFFYSLNNPENMYYIFHNYINK